MESRVVSPGPTPFPAARVCPRGRMATRAPRLSPLAARPRVSLARGTAALLALVLASLPAAHGDVVAVGWDNRTMDFDDMPAMFGYQLPKEGLKGYLVYAKPANACQAIAGPPHNSSGLFIVLVRRYDCNFDVKVLNAQKAGFKAAIVHNVDSNQLLSMGPSDADIWKKIDIPSVFVGQSTADVLLEEFVYDVGGRVVLTPDFSIPLEYYLIPFLVIVGICFILLLVFLVVKVMRDRRRERRSRLAREQLQKLPIHKFKKGDPYEVCAICLDEYLEGDKLRVLPCSHAYHCKCVDPWLTGSKRTCPVCKRRVIPSRRRRRPGGPEGASSGATDTDESTESSAPPSSSASSDSDAEPEAGEARDGERTPLLRSARSSFGSTAPGAPAAAAAPAPRHGDEERRRRRRVRRRHGDGAERRRRRRLGGDGPRAPAALSASPSSSVASSSSSSSSSSVSASSEFERSVGAGAPAGAAPRGAVGDGDRGSAAARGARDVVTVQVERHDDRAQAPPRV